MATSDGHKMTLNEAKRMSVMDFYVMYESYVEMKQKEAEEIKKASKK